MARSSVRRLITRPTNAYGRTKVGKTFGKLGKLRGRKVGPSSTDFGVRVRGRR